MKYITHTLEETQKVAQDFVTELNPKQNSATIVGLYGDLGAGKTSFTQGVAKALGVAENIVSPTFVIEKIYEIEARSKNLESSRNANTFSHLIHIDVYRLEKSSELVHLGWQEIISNPSNLILIEWPEKVADIMPEHIRIQLTSTKGGEEREIEIMI